MNSRSVSLGNGYFTFPGVLCLQEDAFCLFLNFSFFFAALPFAIMFLSLFVWPAIAGAGAALSLSLCFHDLPLLPPGRFFLASLNCLIWLSLDGVWVKNFVDQRPMTRQGSLLESSTGTLPAAAVAKIYTSYPCLERFCFYCCLSARAPRTPHGKQG